MDYRIGAGTGFAGDRYEPAEVLARSASLDALVFECLAERTIALAVAARDAAGGGRGFDPRIVRRISAVLPLLDPRTIIVTNAGAADPRGGALAIREAAAELGRPRVVAAVTGDDVLDILDPSTPVLGADGVIGDFGDRIVSANAYLGSQGIVDALDAGADVVVSGRVGDASLFVGPLRHHHGWAPDALDRIADATLVGHLLECAGQLTGGYFADGVRKTVPDLARLGFPYADVAPGGAAVYRKVEGTGGRLDRRTVLEQLLYEIDTPRRYLTPDVAVDLSAVRVDEVGPDAVAVVGASAVDVPGDLKVSVGVRDGHVAIAEISYAGAGCVGRAQLAERIIRERWVEVLGRSSELRSSLIGVDATRPWWRDEVPEPSEVRLRMSVRSFDPAEATDLCEEVEALYTNGPSGGGGATASIRETVGMVSALIHRDAVRHRVEVL